MTGEVLRFAVPRGRCPPSRRCFEAPRSSSHGTTSSSLPVTMFHVNSTVWPHGVAAVIPTVRAALNAGWVQVIVAPFPLRAAAARKWPEHGMADPDLLVGGQARVSPPAPWLAWPTQTSLRSSRLRRSCAWPPAGRLLLVLLCGFVAPGRCTARPV